MTINNSDNVVYHPSALQGCIRHAIIESLPPHEDALLWTLYAVWLHTEGYTARQAIETVLECRQSTQDTAFFNQENNDDLP